MNPSLIILFFLIATSVSPVYSKVTEENFRTRGLPSFRHNKNYIELQGINTLDLLLQPDAKTVSVEVTGAESNKLQVDKKSGKVFGLEILPLQRLRASHLNNNGVYHKRKKRVINKTKFNLKKRSAKPLLIQGNNFKIFKVPVRGVFSGSYGLRVSVDGVRKTETQVITKENFRIDSITPSVINAGVESQFTIMGKGLDLFTKVSFYDPNGKEVQITDIAEVESLDEETLKVKVLFPEDYTPGFHNVTISSSLRANETSTLLNGVFIGDVTGATGSGAIGVCDDSDAGLMINAIELLPEAKSVSVFDPTLCHLTVGIPRSKDEGRAVENIDVSPDQSNNLLSMGFCNTSTDTLMVFTNNLTPGSQATTFFDPVKCNLTFGIPVGFNGALGESGATGESGASGMGLCNDRNATPITMTVTLPAGSEATIDLNPVACTITYGIPKGETGTEGQTGFSCWDLNLNMACDLSTEDKNKDNQCNPFDCQGAAGIEGEAGIDCWDLNENRIKDSSEDTNRDGFVDVKDCLGATGYTGATGASGLNSLVKITNEPTGANCETGGKKVQGGLDTNRNSVLDSSEITQTEYVCNGAVGATGITGASGLNNLVNITNESSGSNCATGGKKIQNGFDSNNNSLLDSSEVTQIEYICNGAVGEAGTSGLNSLVKTANEPAGSNCETGGKKVQVGLDSNKNSVLDSSEITETEYICNGVIGVSGLNSLVNTINESAGSNCEAGGKKVQSGLDINKNNILDLSEVIQTGYICNGVSGEAGVSGLSSLVKITNELAGANCTTGGKKIQGGLDGNKNNVLDSSEIAETDYVCNGATGTAGLNSLVSTINEPTGSNCTTGGKKIQSGLDANKNGVLDSSEISETTYVCNGASGEAGISGLNSLVNATDEPAGSQCVSGGEKIQSGLDANKNGVLDSSEISQTAYVCDGEKGETGDSGISGLNSLVFASDEPAGSNCATGGKEIQSGLDSNRNGILDSIEVLETDYICNGETGISGINCWDLNGNRINDANEDINKDGTFNTFDCNAPQIKPLQEIIIDWINDSNEQNFTTTTGDMTRMVKIPYFIHDGIVYGGFWVDKYEASRSDASAISEGTSNIPISKRTIAPWTNLTLAEAQGAASSRQITNLGECHLIKMREWYALYLIGRYTKQKGVLGATATSGWNERGNTRSGQDGRDSLLFTCTNDTTQGLLGSGRCLTGTGYKSWGHFLDSTAVSNVGLGSLAGLGELLALNADSIKDDGNGIGADTFDGDFQVYDLVGNVREWIDFTVTKTQDGTIIDEPYQGANESLPFTLNNTFFSFSDVATGNDTAQIDFEGLGIPIRGTNTNVTDLNGGANDGKLFTSSTNQQYGVVRGGSWTSGLNSRSPLYLNISTTPATQETQRGFRVTCGF